MSKKISIVGGHGKVALHLARFLSSQHRVTCIIRDPAHEDDIKDVGGSPLVISLEDAPVSEFTGVFEGQDVVYFAAGAGGKDGEERTKKVDYEGALKVFDAIEGIQGILSKPRLVMVSAIDLREQDKVPAHYNEEDIAMSKRIWNVIPAYMKWKYEADKNLANRTTFKWTIVRFGGLTNNPGVGTASIGRTHLSPTISREDAAKVLALLLDRDDAAGLAMDVIGGEKAIEEGLDAFIEKGETDFVV